MAASGELSAVAGVLRSARKVLVTCHMSPDADAYGAACGLTLALIEAGLEAVCFVEGHSHPRYRSMPGVSEMRIGMPEGDWDVLVVCDCGALKRVGDSLVEKLRAFPVIVNLDHHLTNERFGRYNVVDAEACSTSEIVFDLLTEMKLGISAQTAGCLLWGVMGDTGSFRFASTRRRTFEVAAALAGLGAEPWRVADGLYCGKSLEQVRLEGAAMAGVSMHADGRIAEVLVTEEMYKDCSSRPEHTEQLVDMAREISGVLIAVLIRRDGNLWKVSLRSKTDVMDVSDIAARFGGGGHRMASAFRWRKDLEDLRRELFEALTAALSLR